MIATFKSTRSFPVTVRPGKLLTFGDFVAGVYRAWGERQAKGIVQLAVKSRMVEFRGAERFTIS